MQQQSSSTPTKVNLKAVTPGHLVVSTIVTALVAAGDAGLQYFQSNGANFSLVQLVGAVLIALFATLGTGVISLEKNPTIEQAIDGALAPHINNLSNLVGQHTATISQAQSLISYLVSALQQHQAQLTQLQAKQPVTPQPAQSASQQNAVTQPAQITYAANYPNQGASVNYPTQNLPAVPLQGVQPGGLVRHFGDSQLIPVPPQG